MGMGYQNVTLSQRVYQRFRGRNKKVEVNGVFGNGLRLFWWYSYKRILDTAYRVLADLCEIKFSDYLMHRLHLDHYGGFRRF